MVRTNTVHERVGANGVVDYVVDIGNVLVDDKMVTVGKLVVPLHKQSFFTLPAEKGKYAVVNVYYDIDHGTFFFDRVLVSDKFIPSYNALVIPNLIPLAQFVVKQSAGGFVVEAVNECSKMATYAVNSGGETGVQGMQGPLGPTGWVGHSGAEGHTGFDGSVGYTGMQGPTGVGAPGEQGVQGCTGVYPDLLLFSYFKFKSDDDTQVDYSEYQRDFTWAVTGVGYTGSTSNSEFVVEPGIVDNCHSVVYRGDGSAYTYDEYVDFSGFTGVIQAWVRVDVIPESDFSYTGVQGLTGVLRFTEKCTYFPESFSWYYDNTKVSTSKIFTQVVSTGEHLVRLEASNIAGTMSKTKLVIMP